MKIEAYHDFFFAPTYNKKKRTIKAEKNRRNSILTKIKVYHSLRIIILHVQMIKKKKTNIGEIWKKSLKKFLKISLLSLTYNKKKRAINAGEK